MMTASTGLPSLVRTLGAVVITCFSSWLIPANAQDAALTQQLSSKELIRALSSGDPIRLTSAKPTEWKKVYNHFCRRASTGSVSATTTLAWLSVHGAGTTADTQVAGSLFQRAAVHGDLQAQQLASMFQTTQDRLPKCLTGPAQAQVVATNKAAVVKRRTAVAPRKIARAVNRLARRYKIDPRLVMAIAQIESGFRTQVVSPQKATGLMQLTPDTAARFGVKNSRNWVENLAGGMAYLRWLLAYFEGDVVLVAAAYNSGEGNVNKYAGVPPFQETMDYVAKVRAIYHRDWHPFNAKISSPSPAMAKIRSANEKVAFR